LQDTSCNQFIPTSISLNFNFISNKNNKPNKSSFLGILQRSDIHILKSILSEIPSNNSIVGGDFNAVVDHERDTFNLTKNIRWNSDFSSASRIDYLFISENLSPSHSNFIKTLTKAPTLIRTTLSTEFMIWIAQDTFPQSNQQKEKTHFSNQSSIKGSKKQPNK